MACELRSHGESYGWEVQILRGGDFFYGYGGFARRDWAVAWAEAERKFLGG